MKLRKFQRKVNRSRRKIFLTHNERIRRRKMMVLCAFFVVRLSLEIFDEFESRRLRRESLERRERHRNRVRSSTTS